MVGGAPLATRGTSRRDPTAGRLAHFAGPTSARFTGPWTSFVATTTIRVQDPQMSAAHIGQKPHSLAWAITLWQETPKLQLDELRHTGAAFARFSYPHLRILDSYRRHSDHKSPRSVNR